MSGADPRKKLSSCPENTRTSSVNEGVSTLRLMVCDSARRNGALVPLSSVAALEVVSARSLIAHEDGLRRQVVIATPTGADQAGFARRARQSIAAHVKLPPNVYLRYGGTAPAQAAAARELLWHAAAALVLIVLLLALAFGHSRHVLLVSAALPGTLIGGVLAVALSGATLSLGAMVGFVALFGIAARNTILLISHYEHLITIERRPWGLPTALQGAEERLIGRQTHPGLFTCSAVKATTLRLAVPTAC